MSLSFDETPITCHIFIPKIPENPLISDCLRFSHVPSRNYSCNNLCKFWLSAQAGNTPLSKQHIHHVTLYWRRCCSIFILWKTLFVELEAFLNPCFLIQKNEDRVNGFQKRGETEFCNSWESESLPVTTLGAQSGNCVPAGRGSGKYLDIVQEGKFFINISCCYSGGWESHVC